MRTAMQCSMVPREAPKKGSSVKTVLDNVKVRTKAAKAVFFPHDLKWFVSAFVR